MQASLQRVPDGVIGAADGRRMDFGGRIKRRKPSRDRRVSHPLSIGARMMVRVSERAFDNVNLGGIAEVQRLLSHVGGMKVFFFFPALFRQDRASSAAQNQIYWRKTKMKNNIMKKLFTLALAA